MPDVWIFASMLFVIALVAIFFLFRHRRAISPAIPPEPIEAPPEPEPAPVLVAEPYDVEKALNDLIFQTEDIGALFARLGDATQTFDSTISERVTELRELLSDVLSAEYDCNALSNKIVTSEPIDLIAVRARLQRNARKYLDNNWLHTPSLAAMITVALLDCEIADQSTQQLSTQGRLRSIRDEIAIGYFETDEITARLRHAEQQGCYFSSLVYRLLAEGWMIEPEPLPEPESELEPDPEPEPLLIEEQPEEEIEPPWSLAEEVSNLIQSTPELARQRFDLVRRSPGELERFRRLVDLLVDCCHEYDLAGVASEDRTSLTNLKRIREQLQQAPKQYDATPSLHSPWFRHHIPATLIYAESLALPEELRQIFAPILRIIADDFAAENSDSDETARRLRRLEDRGLYVSSLVYLFLQPPRPPVKPADAKPIPLMLNTKEAVQVLIETNSELSDLYKKLGYSAELDRNSSQLIKEMKDLIRTEIPDFTAFKSALKAAQEQAERPLAAEVGGVPSFKVKYQTENNALLSAVLAASDDQTRVSELLNRDPINEQLPFIEQLPVFKNGVTVWRTPLEHSLIRKRPSDPERFVLLLDQLEALFNDAKHPQNRQVHEELLEAITRVRRDLAKENAYMPTALQALEAKIIDYMAHSRSAASQAKKDQLDAVLEELLKLRHDFSVMSVEPEFAGRSEFVVLKQNVQQQSKKYLETNWMYTPWLTTQMLAALLDCELAIFDETDRATANTPAGVLKIVRDEIDQDCYDTDESIRRLQYQEARGLYINSLIYPLLRLNGANSRPRPASRTVGTTP